MHLFVLLDLEKRQETSSQTVTGNQGSFFLQRLEHSKTGHVVVQSSH